MRYKPRKGETYKYSMVYNEDDAIQNKTFYSYCMQKPMGRRMQLDDYIVELDLLVTKLYIEGTVVHLEATITSDPTFQKVLD